MGKWKPDFAQKCTSIKCQLESWCNNFTPTNSGTQSIASEFKSCFALKPKKHGEFFSYIHVILPVMLWNFYF